MVKSDLHFRPIYHRKRDFIEAHLTIVFAALAVSRWIEHKTGWSTGKFVKTEVPDRPVLPACVHGDVLLAQHLPCRGEPLFPFRPGARLVAYGQEGFPAGGTAAALGSPEPDGVSLAPPRPHPPALHLYVSLVCYIDPLTEAVLGASMDVDAPKVKLTIDNQLNHR